MGYVITDDCLPCGGIYDNIEATYGEEESVIVYIHPEYFNVKINGIGTREQIIKSLEALIDDIRINTATKGNYEDNVLYMTVEEI